MSKQSKQLNIRYDQRGQTVYGSQTNVAGDQHIHLSPIEPSAAVAPAPPADFVGARGATGTVDSYVKGWQICGDYGFTGDGWHWQNSGGPELAEQLRFSFPARYLSPNLVHAHF